MVSPKAVQAHRTYYENLLLKMNAKVGGLNVRIASSYFRPLGPRFVVMGISIALARAIERLGMKYSYCGVSMSLDPRAERYTMNTQWQERTNPFVQLPGKAITVSTTDFYTKWDMLPTSIFIYCNGVPRGLFEQLLESEMMEMQRCLGQWAQNFFDKEWNPKITMLVMQRAGHMRLMLIEESMREGFENCPAVTVVDRTITHRKLNDFFLVSQVAAKGVTKPMRYTVLQDDINMTMTCNR